MSRSIQNYLDQSRTIPKKSLVPPPRPFSSRRPCRDCPLIHHQVDNFPGGLEGGVQTTPAPIKRQNVLADGVCSFPKPAQCYVYLNESLPCVHLHWPRCLELALLVKPPINIIEHFVLNDIPRMGAHARHFI